MDAFSDFSNRLKARYPEAGEIKANTLLGAEQARHFGNIVSAKVLQLALKPSLSLVEKTFIYSTADLGARSIIYLAEQKHLEVVKDSEAFPSLLASAGKLSGRYLGPDADLITALHKMTEEYPISSDASQQRRDAVEYVAMYSMRVLGGMIEKAGGIEIDNYLAGNLQGIITEYDNLEGQT